MSVVTWITLCIIIPRITSIQNPLRPVRFIETQSHPVRNFRHIGNSPSRNFDWEPGLREATVQALLREPIVDHNLRRHIYGAPLLGKQDKSTPFGDIAILARGQLYANFAGFIFVQDPYQNECDECLRLAIDHKERCINSHCQKWRPRSNEQLIALWKIKRIRHRSTKDGYNLEVEYTISPIGVRYSKDKYVNPEGTFNYNYPGHIFVLRTTDTDSIKINLLNQGAYIAQSPDGRKYILHNYPAVLLPQKYLPARDNVPLPTSTATEEDPRKLYQTLLELLHQKTSVEPNRLTPTTQKTTTLVQLPTGQLVPITELQTPYVTKTTPGYVTVRFPEPSTVTSKRPTSPATTQHHVPQTTSQVFYTNGLQTTRQPLYTTQPVYTNSIAETTKLYTSSTLPQTTKPQVIYTNAIPQTTKYTDTTKPPVKTTFSFFAAEEEPQISIATEPTRHFTTRTTHQPFIQPTRYTSVSDFSVPITVLDEEQSDQSTIATKFTTSVISSTQTEETDPTKYTIDTTLGQTSTLGSAQNQTVVYYMAEETSTTPQPTSTITSPKRISTTIVSSVKTTPLDFGQELFGSTKSTTKVMTSPKVVTQPSQFLAEDPLDKPNVPPFAKPVKDYSEDEIFGNTKSTRTPTSRSTKKYEKSDLEQALFDTNGRSGKSLIRSRFTEATPAKVIHADHFETSTVPMNSELTSTTPRPSRKFSVSKKPATENPVTIQSLKTSISYEVNRKKKYVKKDRNKSLENDFALRLVGQAKGFEYLDAISTTGASTIASTIPSTKQSKYTRRRSYVPKGQRAKKKVGR